MAHRGNPDARNKEVLEKLKAEGLLPDKKLPRSVSAEDLAAKPLTGLLAGTPPPSRHENGKRTPLGKHSASTGTLAALAEDTAGAGDGPTSRRRKSIAALTNGRGTGTPPRPGTVAPLSPRSRAALSPSHLESELQAKVEALQVEVAALQQALVTQKHEMSLRVARLEAENASLREENTLLNLRMSKLLKTFGFRATAPDGSAGKASPFPSHLKLMATDRVAAEPTDEGMPATVHAKRAVEGAGEGAAAGTSEVATGSAPKSVPPPPLPRHRQLRAPRTVRTWTDIKGEIDTAAASADTSAADTPPQLP